MEDDSQTWLELKSTRHAGTGVVIASCGYYKDIDFRKISISEMFGKDLKRIVASFKVWNYGSYIS
ncbi:MAG: hypothetical protein QW186_09685 [Candidatus Bathyarchaeia archaeon]